MNHMFNKYKSLQVPYIFVVIGKENDSCFATIDSNV